MRIVHPYHIVENSPWPLTSSLSAWVFAMGLIMKCNNVNYSSIVLGLGMILIGLSSILWWQDVAREGTYQGKHTKKVKEGLKIGMILFFVSESCLFASFFWAYFHASLTPNIELGTVWPPEGMEVIDPWGIPLMNIIVLLSSGIFLTWGHEKIIAGEKKEAKIGLILTILLGVVFLILQYNEFKVAPFTLADSSYGSSFYILTTCHMLHVIIGIGFLTVGYNRMDNYTRTHHLGLEGAIWYWHLVDVVYLFVFCIVYWWGSQ